MQTTELASALGEALARAFEQRGYDSLTPVQQAVLDPEHAGRDLRVSSQTGSGKTVALGLAVRDVVTGDATPENNHARPRALVLVPTRELAKQVHEELSWLFRPLGLLVAAVTGGGGYRDELRSFRNGPAIVVGTPGRLRDHLDRGSLDTSNVAAIVMDEADRMLDFGFREEIEAIVAMLPAEKRVHLVSATFPREVRALADRVQRDPAIVMGTPLGAANQDIEHVVHLVHQRERLDAIVNLLLSDRTAQTLIFAHTRIDVADLGAALAELGFTVGTLSGEMEQAERNRALAAFKRGNLDAMVATDVAARGIDVADVSRVIHADPPNDPDAYTHRSGRTGRAGKKGTSSVLVTPPSLVRVLRTLERARVTWRMDPIPTAESLLATQDEKLISSLLGEPGSDGEVHHEAEGDLPPRLVALAERLLASGDAPRVVARLLARVRSTGPAPRHVTPIAPPAERRREGFTRGEDRPRFEDRPRGEDRPRFERPEGGPPGRRPMTSGDPSFRAFRVTWGTTQGADARRLLAVVCRRGNIRGADVGTIRMAPTFSVVEVKADVAETFERSAREPDPRAPRVKIQPWIEDGGGGPRPTRPGPAPREEAPAIPAERPSRAKRAPAEDVEIPAERPSRAKRAPAEDVEIPAERPSRAKRAPAEEEAPAIPVERPSRAKRAPAEEAPIPAERPSRAKRTPAAEEPEATPRAARPTPPPHIRRPPREGGPAPRERREGPSGYGTGPDRGPRVGGYGTGPDRGPRAGGYGTGPDRGPRGGSGPAPERAPRAGGYGAGPERGTRGGARIVRDGTPAGRPRDEGGPGAKRPKRR